jgi:hypothetical protein
LLTNWKWRKRKRRRSSKAHLFPLGITNDVKDRLWGREGKERRGGESDKRESSLKNRNTETSIVIGTMTSHPNLILSK